MEKESYTLLDPVKLNHFIEAVHHLQIKVWKQAHLGMAALAVTVTEITWMVSEPGEEEINMRFMISMIEQSNNVRAKGNDACFLTTKISSNSSTQ